jgi:hypothetical protein
MAIVRVALAQLSHDEALAVIDDWAENNGFELRRAPRVSR